MACHAAFLLVAAACLLVTCGAGAAPSVAPGGSCSSVTINNLRPRLDTSGSIMDAHDGNVNQWEAGGLWYMYAMAYGDCHEQPTGCSNVTDGACGFRFDHNISVFTSSDLASGSWTFQGYALPVDRRPSGIYYRPKIVYNPNTKLYVLWVNWLHDGVFSQSQYLVATSPTPVGPFKVVNSNVTTRYTVGGDFDVFVDDDPAHTAYLIYTSLTEGHGMSVEQLAPDYLSSMAVSDPALNSGVFNITFVEAPALFKRGSFYYAMFGECCCFCGSGSGANVYVAEAPLGPYTYQGQVGRYPNGSSVTHAQQNYVIQVPQPDGSTLYVWTGDRWQSAPNHIKADDFQYWAPLVWVGGDGTDTAAGAPRPMLRAQESASAAASVQQFQWQDSFTMQVCDSLK